MIENCDYQGEIRPLTPAARRLLRRAARMLHPGPVPAHLVDLVDPRFHTTDNPEKTVDEI